MTYAPIAIQPTKVGAYSYFFKALKIIVICTLHHGQVYAEEASAYHTNGIGSLEKCKVLVIQVCNSENVAIPNYIETNTPPWRKVYHEKRKDGTNMCWLKLKDGGLTKETLSFACIPAR